MSMVTTEELLGTTVTEPARGGARLRRSAPDRGRRGPSFRLRLLLTFVLAVGVTSAVQYQLQSKGLREVLIADLVAVHAAEARALEGVSRADERRESSLNEINEALSVIGSRPGVESALVIDGEGFVVAAAEMEQIGSKHGDQATSQAITSGRSFAGPADAEGEDEWEAFELVAPIRTPFGQLAFVVERDGRLLDAQLAELRQTLHLNVLIGLLIGIPVFYAAGGRSLAGMYQRERQTQAQRRRLLEEVTRAAETERMRIAAEIHDGPIQRLTALLYRLEPARRRLQEGKFEEGALALERLQGEISEETHGLRRLMASLRPPVLDEKGLSAALKDHLATFSDSTGLEYSLEAVIHRRLQPEFETLLFRVAQEALVNVRRHAKASHMWVSLDVREGMVEFVVRDDGVGFDPIHAASLAPEGHVGLVAMRERVEMAGGKFEIVGGPGAGTTIRVSFREDQVST